MTPPSSEPQAPTTPEEFAARMKAIITADDGYFDEELGHLKIDDLMKEVLRSLGYGEGVDISDTVNVWYA